MCFREERLYEQQLQKPHQIEYHMLIKDSISLYQSAYNKQNCTVAWGHTALKDMNGGGELASQIY